MQEGLYKVQFQTPMDSGAGVIVLEGGKIRGGDSMMFYHGSYSISGDQITADVVTNVHTTVKGMQSVFGINQVTINLTGKITGDTLQLVGKSPQAANVPFQAILTKLKA